MSRMVEFLVPVAVGYSRKGKQGIYHGRITVPQVWLHKQNYPRELLIYVTTPFLVVGTQESWSHFRVEIRERGKEEEGV